MPALIDSVDIFNYIGKIRINREFRNYLESKRPEKFQTFRMGRDCLTFNLLDIEDKDGQPSCSGYSGVFLTQTTRCGITRILKGFFFIFNLTGNQFLEDGKRHINFTAYLKIRQRPIQTFGNILDGCQVHRHILTDKSVSSGRTADKKSVPVFKRYRQTVDFGFHRIRRMFFSLQAAVMESPEFFLAENVLKRTHLYGMGYLIKGRINRIADTLRRRIRSNPFGMCFFRLFQLTHQTIIFIIRYFRIVHCIIKSAVMIQPIHQLTVFVLLHGMAS